MFYLNQNHFINFWTLWIFSCYALQIIFCLILTIYIIPKRNKLANNEGINVPILPILPIPPIDPLPNPESPEFPKISIKKFKKKQEGSKSIIYFTIISTIKLKSFISKKNLYEFDNLQNQIKNKLPLSEYPYLIIPEFQILAKYNIDERMEKFAEYLNSLSVAEFMLPELMDFLNIEDPFREQLIKLNEIVLHKEIIVNKTDDRSESICMEKY